MANKTILIVTDRVISDLSRGSHARIFSLIKGYASLGYKVILLCNKHCNLELFKEFCFLIVGINADYFKGGELDSFEPVDFYESVATITKEFSPALVLVEYAWMARCFNYCAPGSINVIDIHDLFFKRSESFQNSELDAWINTNAKNELKLLKFADKIFTIQEEENSILNKLSDIQTICIPYSANPSIQTTPQTQSDSMMFIGSNHAGNNGINDFITNCWQEILAVLPYAQLNIYGSIGIAVNEGKNINIMGVIDDVSIAYNQNFFTICPVFHGSGMKIKLLEAFAYNKTAVTTAFALTGFVQPNKPICKEANNWSEFANQCIRLMTNKSEVFELQLNAGNYFNENYSWNNFLKKIDIAL